MTQANTNFAPSVQCPHCGKWQHCLVSGWGRSGLNSRFKACKSCQKIFFITLYVETGTEEATIEKASGIRSQIKHLRKMARERIALLTKQLEEERAKFAGTNN